MLRNRIIYAFILIISSILVYYEPNLLTSIFFHTAVFLLLFSLVHLIYSHAAIKISQSLSPIVVEHGQKASYKCSIHNEMVFPTSVISINFLFSSTMFKDQLNKKTFTLKGGKKNEFNYELSCKYRGVYAVGIETLEITDILNVFKFKIRNIESKNITVLPKITPLPNFIIAPKAESDQKSISEISAEGANSLVDVRKFENGDALKHIHWKLSARHDELLVRNLERSAQNSTLIFLDTSKGKYEFAKNLIVEDKLMEALVSVVSQCINQNHLIEINYNDFNLVNTMCKNREDFRSFFTSIAKISFMHPGSIKSLVDDYFDNQLKKQNLWGKDIFIFTCHPKRIESDTTIQKLLGNRCNLHIVSCSFNKDSTGSYRTSEEIYYYNLSPSSDLEDIFVRSIM